MMTEDTKQKLREILLSTPPMLFLGAGFSVGSTNLNGEIPLGGTLKDEIVTEFFKEDISSNDLEDIKKN